MKHSIVMLAIVFLWGVYTQAIYDRFGQEGQLANSIVWAESSMRPEVINSAGEFSIGLFQINLNAWYSLVPGVNWNDKVSYLQNPINNIDMAYSIRNCNYGTCSGWSQWGAYTSGSNWQYW